MTNDNRFGHFQAVYVVVLKNDCSVVVKSCSVKDEVVDVFVMSFYGTILEVIRKSF